MIGGLGGIQMQNALVVNMLERDMGSLFGAPPEIIKVPHDVEQKAPRCEIGSWRIVFAGWKGPPQRRGKRAVQFHESCPRQ